MTPPPAIGDRIQWTVRGQSQFAEPPAILGLSSDGHYCFVEGTKTGLPIDQITVVERRPPTADDVAAWLGLVVEPGSVVEFRALNCVDNPKYPPFTVSGWFDHDHLDELAKTAMEWTGKAEGCYVTINPVRPDLLARAANRVVRKPKHTTTDADIVRRVGLVFDADPVRPAGISATEEEKALARELIDRLVSDLTARGWPAPILADSGNGFHARYKIDLAADDGGLVERVLKAAALFSDDRIKIDASLSNPSRIIKLHGTLSRKGDDIPDRPHRWTRILSIPPDFQVVPMELLEALAADVGAPPALEAPNPNGSSNGNTWDVTATSARDAYATKALNDECQAVAQAPKGERNATLNTAALKLGQFIGAGALDRSEVERRLLEAAAGYIQTDGEHAARATIRSGLNAGQNQPRDLSHLAANRNGNPAVEVPIPVPKWPDPPKAEAFHELAGMIVNLIAPSTEADPAGLLLQLLVGFGNAVGRGAWVEANGCRYHANEFNVNVGDTSRARKGTSWKRIRHPLADADPGWASQRIANGLSSGEGLIWEIRDPILGTDKKTGNMVVTDPGVDDKRVLVVESEFGGVLRILAREGNSLSGVLRLAWDGDDLRTMTKNNPARASGPHVSLIGHITQQELEAYLSEVEIFNGLGNRILWSCVRRSNVLPFGGSCDQAEMTRLGNLLAMAVRQAKTLGAVPWASSGRKLWESEYACLTKDRPGLWGAVTARAEAHVLRLALKYTLLDQYAEIEDVHVHAALALWHFCDRSAAHLFGESTGDRNADSIMAALKLQPEGMTRTEIRRTVFNDNKTSGEVARALGLLQRYGVARVESVQTGGRPAERWFATNTKRTCT